MNAAIRSAARTAIGMGITPYGIYRGYEGLLEGDMEALDWKRVGGIVHQGGTILKTARCPAFREEAAQRAAARVLREAGIDGLVVIGGDGSMAGAAALARLGTAAAVVPGTIDNDMGGTDETIGYDSAVNTVLDAARRIRDTAASHNRAAVIEVMGRHSGFIALASGVAAGAEFILVPEVPFDRDDLAGRLRDMTRQGRTNSIIICAEGAADGRALSGWLHERTGIDMCATILGYIQRGGAPTARDAQLGAVLGAAAVQALAAGERGVLAGMQGGRVRTVSFERAFQEKRVFPAELYRLAAGIGAGDFPAGQLEAE